MKKGIIGNGGFGREVFHSLSNQDKENTIFFVSNEWYHNSMNNTLPLSEFDYENYEIIIAIGDPKLRHNIVNTLPKKTKFFTHIHKSVQILDKNIKIGEGSIICAGTILTTNIEIGKHCHLNLQSTIGHDTIIGNFFTTAPGVKISGNCTIGDRVYVGTNSSIREKINICDDVTIGLNSGVVKDINESGIYAGLPSKKIIKNNL